VRRFHGSVPGNKGAVILWNRENKDRVGGWSRRVVKAVNEKLWNFFGFSYAGGGKKGGGEKKLKKAQKGRVEREVRP